ncbi:hypothetical protein CAPTEDRAFT_193373 [Capitella teleta]|uniref:Peptidase M14 domain-containing protein n=1 Tax=Capitella teleta TaxID=283909 RepID=R7UUA9_CAPTE|nr:hypothetical protein CAPTEDRAFT_193373 [Capitella teleta]|eukprot:ELU10069.1 hypothetical protein CAPTEDRAFT_193373 [Capitella teleta]
MTTFSVANSTPLQVDIWQSSDDSSTHSTDMSIAPDVKEQLIELIQFLQIPYETLVPDLQKAIDENMKQNGVENNDGVFRLDRYHPLDEIQDWLLSIAYEYPEITEIIEVGKSFEGRPILVAKISGRSSDEERPAVFLDAGIHSNEWVAPATLIFFINELLTKYEYSGHITYLLNHVDFYILPVFNVDGYVHTWTKDRMWRKSLSRRANVTCQGVDLNRNWPYMWDELRGASADPCSHAYAGPHSESEPEVKAVSSFLESLGANLKAYIAYHSYSQFWMTPFAFSRNARPQHFERIAIHMHTSRRVTEAISGTHGEQYRYGPVADLYGEATGSSIDFANGALGVTYAFGVELRDNGMFGHLLPPSLILPTAEENLAGLLELATIVLEEKGVSRAADTRRLLESNRN